MNKLLVPVDFSSNSTKAVLYAAEIANKNGATVCLFHVMEPGDLTEVSSVEASDFMEEEAPVDEQSSLQMIRESLLKLYPGLHVESHLKSGSVTNSILEFTDQNGIDLIVMGTQGATGLKELLWGSITSSVLLRSKVPLLAIPAAYEMKEPSTILFGTNHFEWRDQLLEHLLSFARLFDAQIHVSVFVDSDTADGAEYIDQGRHLNQYVDRLSKSHPDISFRAALLSGSKFEPELESYIQKQAVDLIALVHYPKSKWELFLQKSTSKAIAAHSMTPVLILPA